MQLINKVKSWLGRFSLDSDMDEAYFDLIMDRDDDQLNKESTASDNDVRSLKSEQLSTEHQVRKTGPLITTLRGVKVEASDLLVAPKPVNQIAPIKQESQDNVSIVNQLDLTSQTKHKKKDHSPHVLDLQS